MWSNLDAHLLEGVSVLAQLFPYKSSSLKALSEATHSCKPALQFQIINPQKTTRGPLGALCLLSRHLLGEALLLTQS